MLSELVNRLGGQVVVRVECAFPERVFNLCGSHRLAFWDLAWESPTAFTCRMSRGDWHRLRRVGKKLDASMYPVRREGMPYFLLRFRRRPALLAGLVLCAGALLLSSFFVWELRVEGNETVPAERILRALEECGVGIGSFGLSLDGEDIRNQMLLQVPELSWLTVNVSGCRAEVQVRERRSAPRLAEQRRPMNLTARRAGLVQRVRKRGGVAAVRRGMTVAEGQLLISGVEDTETYGARIMAGSGSVTARTWYTLTAEMPLTVTEKQYTGREKTCVSLIFGDHRIKIFANSSIEAGNYDKITRRTPLSLFGLPLPLTVERETLRLYERRETARTPAAAERAAQTLLTEYLTQLVSPYGAVSSTLCTSRQAGDVLTVTLRAECVEEIGQSVPIYLANETGTAPAKQE